MDTLHSMWLIFLELVQSPLFQVFALIIVMIGVAVVAFEEGRDYERDQRRQRLAKRELPSIQDWHERKRKDR